MTRPVTLSPTVENYLKHLFSERQQRGEKLLPMGKLAAALDVTPGTATTMVKTLSDSGLVDYEPRDGVRLTPTGERQALRVIRRHRLIELFLVQTLGLDWSEVHEEAEELEHALSDKVLDKLDAFLGHPQFDPHGDPIPGAKGKLARTQLKSVADCEVGRPFRVARIVDQDAQFLQFVHAQGLMPGTKVAIESRDELADAAIVRAAGRAVLTLGMSAAAKILVEEP
jgi:DtxR family Mn-dependent transcriptional regulator